MSFSFSNITDDLFIGITPLVTDYNGLRELGIKLIINMRLMHGPYPDEHPEPIKLLWLRTFDSLALDYRKPAPTPSPSNCMNALSAPRSVVIALRCY